MANGYDTVLYMFSRVNGWLTNDTSMQLEHLHRPGYSCPGKSGSLVLITKGRDANVRIYLLVLCPTPICHLFPMQYAEVVLEYGAALSSSLSHHAISCGVRLLPLATTETTIAGHGWLDTAITFLAQLHPLINIQRTDLRASAAHEW